jgi:uncharacterized protein (TIGR02598 family)
VKPSQTDGFSLIELALAIGVASFCLLTIVALIPTSLNITQTTVQQTADTTWVRAIADDLRQTPKTSPPSTQTSPRYGITIPAIGTATHTLFLRDDGTASDQDSDANPSQNYKYRATITLTAPMDALQKSATRVTILLTWPAMADPHAADAPAEYSGSYEAVTALDRN